MRRFRFNLEALLRVYERDEEQRKKELGIANRARIEAEEALIRLGKAYDAYQEKEKEIREKGETVSQMRLYIQYVFDLKERIEKQKRILHERIKQVNSCREKLIEAKKRLKTIERIKENRWKVWQKERRRFEMKNLDDICQQQYMRERMSG